MFRYRRYRVFLAFAFIAVFAVYKFGTSGASRREAASNAAGLKSDAENAPQVDTKPRPAVAHETKSPKLDIAVANSQQPLQTPPPVKEQHPQPSSSPVVTKKQQKPTVPTPIRPRPHVNPNAPGNGPVLSTSIEAVHWTKLREHFPVASTSLIRLPSGKSKPLPKIQFQFKPEDAATKADRLSKLDTIRGVFKKSWSGYKEHAWLHDELRPMSGTYRDPFANWGATLVDALDTLWIMGMKDEFEEAAKAVDTIDFTTTPRADIPLFETTIRYLGGLVAAYDISGKKYKNLLDKAIELAEILISAFDTPNRMPDTYYYWRPQFASQRHRASTRVVLAEIGSLSMEFTRLAQLTGEHKYYDAIARITDNLEEFQNYTRLPGMWPTYLDASGCGKVYVDLPPQEPLKAPDDLLVGDVAESPPSSIELLSPEGKKYVPLNLPDPIVLTPNRAPSRNQGSMVPGTPANDKIRDWNGDPLEKRQLDTDLDEPSEIALDADEASSAQAAKPTPPECVAQGFVSSSDYGREEYTLGGMSDSTYEYLTKEYLLLGGHVEKYRTMYEQSMDVVKKHLIFRPMLPDEDDILFCGKLNVPSNTDDTKVGDLEGENAHLTCFAGGMFGMGAKLFDRPEDLEIAKKLTEGCVWSYSMTPSGIMPESFVAAPCESTKECAWNETAYMEILDPRSEYRLQNYRDQLKAYEKQLVSASSWYDAQLAAITAPSKPSADVVFEVQATQTPIYADTLDKRQLADLEDDMDIADMPAPSVPVRQNRESVMGGEPEEGEGPPTKVQPTLNIEEVAPQPSLTLPAFPMLYSPNPPLNHKDYVQNRIKEERLPKGVTRIGARNYILRPEAIESVWYMYRITGDSHWREAGWRMFLAINEHTSTIYGNSAIDDVTTTSPQLNDEMESFWLAETLKYFYLLFEEEGVISLDDWVLNTEAHPFKRPK
ncbi:Nn.00g050250.m01.CDS01 [Neocucurbitaria sp. VM-36]